MTSLFNPGPLSLNLFFPNTVSSLLFSMTVDFFCFDRLRSSSVKINQISPTTRVMTKKTALHIIFIASYQNPSTKGLVLWKIWRSSISLELTRPQSNSFVSNLLTDSVVKQRRYVSISRSICAAASL